MQDKRSAFTLLELSIMLAVLSAVLVIIASTGYLFKASQLSSARALTNQSPVNFTDGVVLWLDATSNASFDNNENIDGSEVSIWKNIYSKNSNNFYVSESSNKPNFVRYAINDLPAIEFDGVNDILTSNNNTYLSAKTNFNIFIVFEADTNNSEINGRIFAWGSGSDGNNLITFRIGTLGKDYLAANISDGSVKYIQTANIINNKIPYIASLVFDGFGATDSDKYRLFLNGAQQTITTHGSSFSSITASGNYPFYLGTEYGAYSAGKIAEIIVINKAISDQRKDEIEKYLSKKWGIKLE